ncbi:hypothetical protein X766_06830 [Mesorhizobium sp. LSJC255A00]|nr:hypothetical protein X766_06830 [Mesorhizobium sp. LSJC255A00]ESX71198.1 hypothetical protein X757_25245 [Mesorhizobium sp. LSHC414A00]
MADRLHTKVVKLISDIWRPILRGMVLESVPIFSN